MVVMVVMLVMLVMVVVGHFFLACLNFLPAQLSLDHLKIQIQLESFQTWITLASTYQSLDVFLAQLWFRSEAELARDAFYQARLALLPLLLVLLLVLCLVLHLPVDDHQV